MPDQTAGTFNDEGYLLTGDSAIQSNDEFITITGRLKELIITKGGENVAPLLIEKEMMTQMPVLSNCLVIGDQRKYLTMVSIQFSCYAVPASCGCMCAFILIP